MAEGLRKLGIGVFGEAPWGTHYCVFYETAEDLAEVLAPYVRTGLDGHEFCLLITSPPLDHEDAATALQKVVPGFDECFRKGQIEIVPHTRWFLSRGAFDVQRCLGLWVDKLNAALAKGYDGMRVASNASWLERKDWGSFVEYEKAVNDVIGQRPIIAMCSYLLTQCGASETMDVIANHRLPLRKLHGQWAFADSPERRWAEQALQRSEGHYRGLVENAVDMVCCFDVKATLTYVSSPLLRALGYTRDELVGRPCSHIIAREDHEKTDTAFMRRIRGERVAPYEFSLRRKDGSHLPVEITSNVIYSPEGRPVGTQAILRDISDRRRAQEALRESEARLRAIFEAAKQVAFVISDLVGDDARVVEFSPGAEYTFGYTREEMLGQPASTLCLPEDTSRFSEWIEEVATHEGWLTGEATMVRQSGEQFPALLTLYPLVDEAGDLTAVLTVAIDISERKRSEEELRQHQRQLRRLASQLALTEERERRRIATYLHDHVGQCLAVANIKLGEVRQSALPTGCAEALHDVAELVDQALGDAQSLTFELSSPVLYELGFEAAVEWLAEQTQERDGVVTDFHSDREPKSMTDDVSVVLFQAVRELLVNVVKHAQAHKASVDVRRDGSEIRVVVADDGVGFAASDNALGSERGGGFGLFNLRERLAQLGGRVEVRSEPGRGTRVALAAPLETDT